MTVLITGGAGYIGTVLTTQLLEKGYRVTVVDNLMHRDARPLVSFLRHPQYTFVYGDIRDEAVMKKALRTADAVVHLAGIVGYPACARRPRLSRDVNVKATELLNRLRSPAQLMVNAGTGSVYGKVDENIKMCHEEMAPNPVSVYGAHKAAAEKVLMDKGGAVSLRLATAFGLSPRLRVDLLVNDFCYQAVHAGRLTIYEANFRRTFIHVHDIARAFIHAIENCERMKNAIFNCGDRKMNVQKIRVAELIREQHEFELAASANGTDVDCRNYNMSFKKINDTGFHTTVSLRQGIREMLGLFPHYKLRGAS